MRIKAPDFNNHQAIWYSIGIPIIFICISLLLGHRFQWYNMDREAAVSQLTELLSNYIGLLGIGLAILAILFAIIQLAYKRLSIIRLIIEVSYFLPAFYFGMFNIFICSILSTYQHPDRPFSEYIFCLSVVTEGYLFWLLIPLLCVVLYRTVILTNFSLISELYLKRLYKMAIKEKNETKTGGLRESLQEHGMEVTEELTYLIRESRALLANRFFDFYISILKLNQSSALLKDIQHSMTTWFIESYKLRDKTIFRNLITTWWEYYAGLLENHALEKARYLSSIPVDLYAEYRKNKDADIRKVALSIFPIRLKEFAWVHIAKMVNNPQEADRHYEACITSLFIFPEMIKMTIDEGDSEGLDEILSQLRLLHEFAISYVIDIPGEHSQLVQRISQLGVAIDSLFVTAYSWLIFKMDENAA